MEKLIHKWDRTSLYLNKIVFYAGFAAAALFMLSYMVEILFSVATVLLICTAISVLIDVLLLYQKGIAIKASRVMSDRLSNGDENKITINLENNYDFKIDCIIIDELPLQFQDRKWQRKMTIAANTET